MDFPQLLGEFYTTFSGKADIQSARNLYLERIESGMGRNQYAMYRSPGLRALKNLGGGGTRCLFELNDHLFNVQDGTVNDLLPDLSVAFTYGPIGIDENLVSRAATMNSFFMVSKNVFYRINGGVMTAPATPFTPISVHVLSGLVICLAKTSRQIYFSNDDGQTFEALDFETAEAGANDFVNGIVDHQEFWAFGNRLTQVFVLGEDPSAPLDRIPSGVIEMGLAAKDALAALDNSLFWLGKNSQGELIVYRANGYTPERVSTHAIENAFRGFPHDDAVMQVYQLNGHACLRLTFPSADNGRGATFEFDLSTQKWNQPSWWNKRTGLYGRHRGACYASAFGKIIVGDYLNGWLYELTPDEFTDYGFPLRWERRTPHSTKEGKQIIYRRLDLFMQTGTPPTRELWLNGWSMQPADFAAALAVAVGNGSVTADQAVAMQAIYDYEPYLPVAAYPTPDVMSGLGFTPWGTQVVLADGHTVIGEPPRVGLRFSNDGGEDYGAMKYRSLGNVGDYTQRLFWIRLGWGRDRVWELSGDSPVMQAIVQATFDADVCDN